MTPGAGRAGARRRLAWVAAAGALAAAGSWAWLQRPDLPADAPVSSAEPLAPSLEGWHPEFQARVADARRRLAGVSNDPAAPGALARLYLANGFSAEAEPLLRLASERNPADALWPHLLATLLAGYGQLAEAVPWWQEAARRAPDYAPIGLKLADVFLKTNRPAEARAYLDEVLRREPAHAHARVLLARCEMEEGRWSAARRELQRAISGDAASFGAYSLLATVSEHLGDTRGAEVARGRAAAMGRFRDVADPWQDSLADDCYDVYRLHVLAATAAASGEGARARALLERAKALAPDDARTFRQLARLYAKEGDTEQALLAYAETLRRDPTDAASHLELAQLHRARGEPRQLEAALREGLARAPNAAGLHFELGRLHEAEGRLEEALQAYGEARRCEPETLAAYHEQARVLFRMERFAEALDVVDAGLRRNPGHAPLLLLRMRRQVEQGDEAGARDTLQRLENTGAPAPTLEDARRMVAVRFGAA